MIGLSNKYAEVFDLFGAVAAPNCAQQSAMGNNFSGTAGEVYKQIKFFRGEMHFPVLHGHLMRSRSILKSPASMTVGSSLSEVAVRHKFARTRASSSSMPNGLVA